MAEVFSVATGVLRSWVFLVLPLIPLLWAVGLMWQRGILHLSSMTLGLFLVAATVMLGWGGLLASSILLWALHHGLYGRAHNTESTTLIQTLGLGMLLTALWLVLWGPERLSPQLGSWAQIGPGPVLVPLFCLALWLISRTPWGKKFLATYLNQSYAASLGLHTPTWQQTTLELVLLATYGFGSFLLYGLSPTDGLWELFVALAALSLHGPQKLTHATLNLLAITAVYTALIWLGLPLIWAQMIPFLVLIIGATKRWRKKSLGGMGRKSLGEKQ